MSLSDYKVNGVGEKKNCIAGGTEELFSVFAFSEVLCEEAVELCEQTSGGKEGYQELSTWIHQGEIMLDQSDIFRRWCDWLGR